MCDYLFIGDIHSQAEPLAQALEYASKSNLTPILLGDLFDSRIENDNTFEVMELVWDYKGPLAICQSNHQWKLLRYLQGKRNVSDDIMRTVEALEPHRDKVQRWLESLPYGIRVFSSNGREYRLAHAHFPSKVVMQGDLLLPRSTSSRIREMCLYGSRTQSGGRNFWWLKPTLNSRSWVRVAGHYHQVHLGLDNLSLVLDGSCGDPGGTLVCWDTRLEWKVEFDNPSAR